MEYIYHDTHHQHITKIQFSQQISTTVNPSVILMSQNYLLCLFCVCVYECGKLPGKLIGVCYLVIY